MRNLEKGVAFNRAYRRQWRDYLVSRTREEIAALTDRLTEGLDHESQVLCQAQIDLVPRFYPHPMLTEIFFREDLKRQLLPAKTQEHLKRVGYFDRREALLDDLQVELDLPEQPLPELLLDSGLKYIPAIARRRIAGTAVIDGGAYIGDTASLFARRYAPAVVHAFEPVQKSFDVMTALVRDWGMEETIRPHRMALSDGPGELTLWGAGLGASSVQKYEENEGFEVPTTSIDDFVAAEGIADVGCIKLDVEGAELAAVRGALATIRRDRPILVISIYHAPADFFEIKPLIEGLGLGYRFQVRKITDDFIKELVLICLQENDA